MLCEGHTSRSSTRCSEEEGPYDHHNHHHLYAPIPLQENKILWPEPSLQPPHPKTEGGDGWPQLQSHKIPLRNRKFSAELKNPMTQSRSIPAEHHQAEQSAWSGMVLHSATERQHGVPNGAVWQKFFEQKQETETARVW